jgi:hypothetical protein
MGRKSTKGNRSVGGRKKKPTTSALRTKHDYGNDRVQARLEAFRHKDILGGRAAWIDVFDGIGQLHAIGMLEGHGLDGKLLREAGREYVGLYNYYFIDLLPKGSDLERAYGGRSSSGKLDLIPPATKRELRFAQMDMLLPVASNERYWTHKLLLDHFGLDTVLPLVDRLVNYRFTQWHVPIPDWETRDLRVAGAEDFLLLGAILRGLFALADGAMPLNARWREAA